MSDAEALAARYARSLAAIVAVLGPTSICSCDFPSGCGLPYEAEEALRIAQVTLAGQEA